MLYGESVGDERSAESSCACEGQHVTLSVFLSWLRYSCVHVKKLRSTVGNLASLVVAEVISREEECFLNSQQTGAHPWPISLTSSLPPCRAAGQ